mmetsp:Transcript_27977/g.86541  ORF Transcript_27977/g.86541 Transcript_27977/m.86541 type:complete len:346 (+) Transcript_27977:85-1122(+)
MDSTTPGRPRRAVRPARWRYAVAVAGGSKFTTSPVRGASRPRAARSVANNTSAPPAAYASRAPARPSRSSASSRTAASRPSARSAAASLPRTCYPTARKLRRGCLGTRPFRASNARFARDASRRRRDVAPRRPTDGRALCVEEDDRARVRRSRRRPVLQRAPEHGDALRRLGAARDAVVDGRGRRDVDAHVRAGPPAPSQSFELRREHARRVRRRGREDAAPVVGELAREQLVERESIVLAARAEEQVHLVDDDEGDLLHVPEAAFRHHVPERARVADDDVRRLGPGPGPLAPERRPVEERHDREVFAPRGAEPPGDLRDLQPELARRHRHDGLRRRARRVQRVE